MQIRMKRNLGTMLVVAGSVMGSLLHADAGKLQILQLRGTAAAHTCAIPPTEQGTTRTDLCFTVDLADLTKGEKGKIVGTATDALADVQTVSDGLALTGTTFFHLPQGMLVTRGLTSVQPTTHGSPSATHITGAIPNPEENNILFGTGAFAGARGSVRLSGAVNMSNLSTRNEITFNCLFVIDLEE